MLGRKIAGKSKREMHDLGLVVEPDPHADDTDDAPAPIQQGA